MAVKSIIPANPVFNASVSGTTTLHSTRFDVGYMFSPLVGYLIAVGAGLTATFKIMISMDGVTYYDSGQVLPSVSGSASNFIAQYSGAFPYVRMDIIPSSGTGTVVIRGSAKGGA